MYLIPTTFMRTPTHFDNRVVVLGTTSAGKSAFVNHFFGLQVKRSAVGHILRMCDYYCERVMICLL